MRQRMPGLPTAVAIALLASIVVPMSTSMGTASAQTLGSLTVEPATGLVDGETVQVSGDGYAGLFGIWILQCTAAAEGPEDCDQNTASFAELSEDGSFVGEHQVFAFMRTGNGPVDCRSGGGCGLVAELDLFEPEPAAIHPIAFDPDAPLLPPPTITATPDAGLVDGQTVRVDGQGFGLRHTGAVNMYQCAPQPSVARCRALGSVGGVGIEPDGTFTTDVQVIARMLVADGTGGVDCRTSAEPCLLIAFADGSIEPPWSARTELHFAEDAPPLDDPELEVTPATGLRDFNTLTIRGENFVPGRRASVQVCQGDGPGRCDDTSREHPTADANGELRLDITGWSDFVAGERVNCRQAPGCSVVATDELRGLSTAQPLSFGPPDEPRGRYLDPVFDEVEVERNVVYRETLGSNGEPVELVMDIYQPVGDTAARRPAVVWMHGGWFSTGGPAAMAAYAEAFAQRGYVSISLAYRLRPGLSDADFPGLHAAMMDAYEDATAGINWLRTHATDYRIDRRAIVAGGWSAGAVNATNLAYLPQQAGPHSSRVAAALPIAGWFIDPDQSPFPEIEPLPLPDRGEPPSLVFHGTDDQILPFGSPRDLCPLAHRANITCEYIGYEGDGHGIVMSRQRDIVHRSADFVAAQVLEPLGYFDSERQPHPGRPPCTPVPRQGCRRPPADQGRDHAAPGPPSYASPATPVNGSPDFTG